MSSGLDEQCTSLYILRTLVQKQVNVDEHEPSVQYPNLQGQEKADKAFYYSLCAGPV